MGIKLESMKVLKSLVYVISFPIVISCSSINTNSSEKNYIMAYKKTVLYECINSATNKSLYKFSEENNDLGTAPEVAIIYHSDVEHAKKIGIQYSKKIRTINYSDYQGKKPIFSDCVNFAFSKSVDSIARLKYKNLKKSKLEYQNE